MKERETQPPPWLSRKEARETVEFKTACGGTHLLGFRRWILDASRLGAAQAYRENWDGCREVWKLNYRQRRRDFKMENTSSVFETDPFLYRYRFELF
jgi:hypothetical protein